MTIELQYALINEAFIYDFELLSGGEDVPIRHWAHPVLGISIFVPRDVTASDYDTLINRANDTLLPLRRIFNEGYLTAQNKGVFQTSKRIPIGVSE
jgi:hypothetical protein